jgi:ketosteroid isomerase-like protein
VASADQALEFVRRINAHDVSGLVRMMTADHIFVDSLGKKFKRPSIEDGWRRYFAMVPDYEVSVERSIVEGDTVVLIGRAAGTYVPERGNASRGNRWETPAVWVARIKGGKVSKWQIYADNEPIREKMRSAAPPLDDTRSSQQGGRRL